MCLFGYRDDTSEQDFRLPELFWQRPFVLPLSRFLVLFLQVWYCGVGKTGCEGGRSLLMLASEIRQVSIAEVTSVHYDVRADGLLKLNGFEIIRRRLA